MDEFAQTRPPDDLFDDDFTPIAEPTTHTTISSPSGPTRNRGRGRNQRGHWERGSRAGAGRGGQRESNSGEIKSEDADGDDQTARPKEEGRPDAVKGDRSETGGVKMKKLTEDELTARLASIKLKNAALEEAHRRAEADEASFQRREQQETIKRREERANRREMEGEREKNRLRKMKAVQGREWDAEKNEEDMIGGPARSSRYRRGAHGAVVGDDRIGGYDNGEYRGRGDYAYSPRGPRGRGARGARGNRGDTFGRGRGEGGHQTQPNDSTLDTSADTEFPALPTTTKISGKGEDEGRSHYKDDRPVPDGSTEHPLVSSPGMDRGTWAEQMEVGTRSTDVQW